MSFLGSAAGAVAGGLINAVGGIWANKQNSAIAAVDRDFQREVLQNRNQWQAEDLKKAGINPILTAGSPSGAVGSNAGITMQNPLSGIADGINSALNLDLQERQLKKDLKIGDSVIAKNYADAFMADEQSDYLHNQSEGVKIANDKSQLDLQYFKDSLPIMLQNLQQQLVNSAKDYEVKQSTIDANRASAYQSNSAGAFYDEQKRKLKLDNDFTENLGSGGKLWRSIADEIFGTEVTGTLGRAFSGNSDFGKPFEEQSGPRQTMNFIQKSTGSYFPY
ncbi:MAG TPA: hypothetical protein H9715_10525 [Candidatus Merdibacter merdigallinarum]|nr:hypothetical protein [Candidatus Merdibacter merdigallinarum]